MNEPRVRLEFDGPLAELVLNRPDKLNAIDERMLLDLESAVIDAETRVATRALIVRGSGRAFCAGADLAEAAPRLDNPDQLDAHTDLWRRSLGRLADSPLPSIAAVHGAAVAGGFELSLACDLTVLAEDAHFGDGHTVWGFAPSGGASQRLPRLVGPRLAAWIMFSGDPISAEQARSYGLANEVVAADDVLPTSRTMARRLAERGPAAIATIKRAIRQGLDAGSLEAGLDIEKTLLMEHMSGPEPRAGIEAFARQTVPDFSREAPPGS